MPARETDKIIHFTGDIYSALPSNGSALFWLIWTVLAVLAIALYLAYVLTKAAVHTEGKEKPVTVAFDAYMQVVTSIQKTIGDSDFPD